MTACLALWFVPVVSGAACNELESGMISQILKLFDCYSDKASETLFWFIRKKMLLINIGTYVPMAGVPLQLFETYAIGQFAIHCASNPSRVADERWMAMNWKEIEKEIFSGDRAVSVYEQSTGKSFPNYARIDFIRTVDMVSKSYRLTQLIPGVEVAQDAAGETIHQGIRLAKTVASSLGSILRDKFRR